jgi:hypothetical protein
MQKITPGHSFTFNSTDSAKYESDILAQRDAGYVQVSTVAVGTGTVNASGSTPAGDGAGGAGVATVGTIAVPENTTLQVYLRAVAMAADNSAGGAYRLIDTFRNDGGTVTRVGSANLIAQENTPGWTFTLAISGTDVVITLTGDTALVVNWTVSGDTLVAAA